MKMPDKKWLTKKEVYEVLHKAGFLYKDKTITRRTIRTMCDNKVFPMIVRNEQLRCDLIRAKDVYELIKE